MNAAEYVELREGRGAATRVVHDGWMVACPAHEDRTPSLHVSEGRGGRVIVCCQAGCATGDVLAADRLEFSDLYSNGSQRNGRVEVAAYRYVDERGEVLYEVVRFDPKDFRQRRPNGEWSIKGVRRVLYRLPRVLAAVRDGSPIYIAEGEKDVHALERAGVVATCNAAGAGKWRSEYAEALRGAAVTIISDRDPPGREHAAAVARSLERVAGSVEIVEPAEGKDAADHLAAGRTVAEFVAAREREPEPATDDAGEVKPDPLVDGQPLDPSAIPPDPPDPIPGFPFIIPATTTIIAGPTGKGRSSLAEVGLYVAAKAGHRVAYLGWEVTGDEFNERGAIIAEALGDELTPELLAQLANVRYLDLGDNMTAAWAASKKWTARIIDRYSVVVIDPLAAVASVLGLDFISGGDYDAFHDRIPEPLKRQGLSVVMLDNIGNSSDTKNRPIGASQKTSRPDLAFTCRATHTPVTALVIESTKVRGVRTPWRTGDKWRYERDSQLIVPDLGPAGPSAGEGEKAKPRLTGYMERVSRRLEFAPESGNSRAALRAKVGGKSGYIDDAIGTLIAEGYAEDRGLTVTPRYVHVRRFREDADAGPPADPGPDPDPHPDPDPPDPPDPHDPRRTRPGPENPGPPPDPPDPDPSKGSGGPGRPEPSCNCLYGAAELTEDGRCSRCYGRPA